MSQDLTDARWVNIGSGNGLVLSRDRVLPEPMLTKLYIALKDITRPQWITSISLKFDCCLRSHVVEIFVKYQKHWRDREKYTLEPVSLQSLQWCHNGHDSISNHQPQDCLHNLLFRHRSKKTSNLRITGLCVGNSPVTGEFTAQMASNAENVSIWWRHHVYWQSMVASWYGNPSASLAICEGNPTVTNGFPWQRTANTELWVLSLLLSWTSCWTNQESCQWFEMPCCSRDVTVMETNKGT